MSAEIKGRRRPQPTESPGLKPYHSTWHRGTFRLSANGLLIEPTPTGVFDEFPATTARGEEFTARVQRSQPGTEYNPFDYYRGPKAKGPHDSIHWRLASLAPPGWDYACGITSKGVLDEMLKRAPAMVEFANHFGLPTMKMPGTYKVSRFAAEAALFSDAKELGHFATHPSPQGADADRLSQLLASLDHPIMKAAKKAWGDFHAIYWEQNGDALDLHERAKFGFEAIMDAALQDTRLVIDLPHLGEQHIETLKSETLLAACYAMCYLDLKHGGELVRCLNETCPVGTFTRGRQDKGFCSPACRNTQGQRDRRRGNAPAPVRAS